MPDSAPAGIIPLGANSEALPIPDSSYLSHARYDEKLMRLEVGFKYGGIVQHWPVYKQAWIDFKLAPSKGSYYHRAIKATSAPIKIK